MNPLRIFGLIILIFPLVCFGEAFKYYRVLGVDRNASPDKIESKFKALVKAMHPDTNNGDRSKEQELIEVIDAYKVLRNERLRAEYDRAQASGVADEVDAGAMTDHYLDRIAKNEFALEAFKIAFQMFGEGGIEFRDMRCWLRFENKNHVLAYALMAKLRKNEYAVRNDQVYMHLIDSDLQIELFKEIIRLRGSQISHLD